MNIKDQRVAVIGMSGKFPGANSVAEFWENICAKKDSIRALSDEELRSAGVPERDIADSAYVKASALLDDVAMFDPGFFRISPLEAELMDPQIRLLLQCAWETLEDAGHARKEAQNIGVFAGAGGVTTSYFANFVNLDQRFKKITAGATHLGNDKDFLATYISYKLNLTGPSMTVQTACSTSLVALHQACQSVLHGECAMALAGGVTVRVPHVQGYHYQEGYIFSRSGQIRAFDEAADGVVFGSGLGLVLVKRLADAIADGDHIYAVIKGSAIMNDGKGKMSYAASSAKGQIACVRAALARADVEAGSIGFVESHGTGTLMGDPEEVKALSAAFKEQTDKKAFCALGAVKANIGHLEAAAGIAGFIKAVLAVRHGLIPPTAHYATPNPRIKFDNTPFFINGGLQQWDDGGKPRRAAVNSLGVGGTNAFVIIENYVAPKRSGKKVASGPVVVPLSAKSSASLHGQVQKLAAFLASEPVLDLADLAYTLQTGREAMGMRAAFVAGSLAELRTRLANFLDGNPDSLPEGETAAAWVGGADIDWHALNGSARRKRVSLPTYAFARQRCWIDPVAAAPAAAMLHPLLHVNKSDLNEQKYSSTFNGEEFFLKDHLVRTKPGASALQKVLPAVACLEMARAAIEQAAPVHADASVLELRDIVWLRPIPVDADTQVNIAIVADQRIGFEIYASDDQIHCQGWCQFSTGVTAERFDPAQLTESMGQGHWSGPALYAAFETMGLAYGPAHRPIAGIERGDRALLARLNLPASVQAGGAAYVLHPSLMDGALQAATVLMFDPARPPRAPIVPFAIDSVQLLAPCSAEMLVWARHADGDKAASFDIDMLDVDGNLCVRIRGFAPRPLGREVPGSLLATREWQRNDAAAGQAAHAEQHVMLCGLPQVDADRIARDCLVRPLDSGEDAATRYADMALACFDKLQSLVNSKPQGKTLLQLVLPNTEENTLYAGLSGMFKTATLENPQVAGQIVLVDAGVQTDALAALLLAERAHAHDTLIKYEGGARHTAGWRFLSEDAPAESPFKDHGVYLITGGLGGLGVLFAKEILSRCATATIVLTGRAAMADLGQKQAVLASLQADGARVEYRQVDLEDAGQVDALIAAIRTEHRQLNGIIHSAGMTADAFILKKTAQQMRQVLGPKVAGTVHLDQATRDLDLDFLALFSSLTASVGNLGQADYAAANGFLNEFAVSRGNGRTVAIGWPLWEDGGMQVDAAARDQLHEATGIHPMRSRTGMRMFYRSLALGVGHTLVMEGNLNAMQRALGVGAALHVAAPAAPAVPSDGLAQQCEAFLCTQLAGLLKLAADMVDPRAPLGDYGIDSILALDLTRVLENSFGALPKTLFFEYLNIRELAGYFAASHGATLAALFSGAAKAPLSAPTGQEPTSSIRSRRRAEDRAPQPALPDTDAIAIVGLSGRYPEARDLDAFWDNLRDGKDCIVEVPGNRWDWREYYTDDRTKKGHHFSKWGGFIDGVDEFDARFFNISPLEAETIDPQERLFLEHAWMAIEDAGYTRASLQSPNGSDLPGQVGVYAGVMYGEYQLLGAEASMQGKRMGMASNVASIANRVSYALNLHGPSMAVDTMCSSSLTAIHLACQDLKLGRTPVGIAGGVNVTIHPNKYLMLSSGQFISGDGHCQSFGEGGDGYIPGEGVGVVVLKRLADAQRDGNHIHGVIRASALSHGGRTNGYTVPNPQAQASAIRQALAQAGVEPRHISYIEAHGTGTKLGDPIEIAALSRVFQESTEDTGFCLIGSAKSNIGHCEAAAGIAGLTKVLLQMKHRQIVPSLHSTRLNPHIDFASTPFVVNQTLTAWERPVVGGRQVARIAGISSFGAGGSNAHVIVEEYVPAAVAAQPAAMMIFPLSARSTDQLREKARDLLAFMRTEGGALPLASIAYTLGAGREAMAQRFAVVADSAAALVERLQAYVDGRTAGADLSPLAALAESWVKGADVDWSGLHTTRPPLVSLPTYPFARQRHWLEIAPRTATLQSAPHPLLHANTSDFTQQSYTSTFAHRLTRATCLDMARAAVGLSMPSPSASMMLELSDLAFAQPDDAGGIAVTIALFDKRGDQVAFEIYRGEVVYCQGRAAWRAAAGVPVQAPARLVQFSVDNPLPEKPQRSIALRAPDAVPADAYRHVSKPRISLSGTVFDAPAPATSASPVGLFDLGDGIFTIRIADASLSPALIGELLRAMRAVADAPAAKALTIEGGARAFLTGGLAQHRQAVEAGLYKAVAEFPYPVIAVAQGDATGAGFLLAAVCDFVVCSESARYAFAQPADGLYPSAAEDLLAERYGRVQANDFLYLSAGATGAELKAKGWTCPIVAADAVDGAARALAAELATKSQTALRLLKQHLARAITEAVHALPAVADAWFAPVTAKNAQPQAAYDGLHLALHGDRVLIVTIRSADGLTDSLAKVLQTRACRCVVLTSELPQFLPAADEDNIRAIMLDAGVPVVAALTGDASGAGWLLAHYSDACVYSEQGRYAGPLQDPHLPALASLRFGDDAAKQFLMAGAMASGAELRTQFGMPYVVPAGRVLATALKIAEAVSAFPTAVLGAWKKRSAGFLQAANPLDLTEKHATRPATALRLASAVISATAHPDGVLEVRMADRDAKNMFSDAFSNGLREVFAHVEASGAYKVLLLTGYDNYFSSGGTQDTLLAIHEGRARFTDNLVFQLPLLCSVPVVAAMQGHGIGAGWAMGMYADFTLFSDESRYVSPYMGYGFTPGAGSTQMFPAKIGHDLARETLLTAREFAGGELKERGMRHSALAREQVLPAALAMARRIAQSPRALLVALKRHWSAAQQVSLADTLARELAMHELTFVGQADTLARIQSRFGSDTPVQRSAVAAPAGAVDLAAVSASLKAMLAHELRMQEHEIAQDEQFVDLGLDSITGVTWIRRINDTYGTAIEAIKVYSYPTLAALSAFVAEEAGLAGAVVEAPEPVAVTLTSWRQPGLAKAAELPPVRATQAIAIIGMAGQFAKSNNLDEYWQNIAQGRDCIDEIPKHRYDIDLYFQAGDAAPGKTYSRWMGALDDVDLFDAAFFNISPREAKSMDPQQRLFLQTCWHSIEHAGYNPKSLAGSKCGVFAGCYAGDYHQLSTRERLSGQGFTGASPSILPARISYLLDLHGPSIPIDSACSSSLVAVAMACDSLVAGASDMALAGGVNVMAGPSMQIMTSQVGMLSPQGRCFTFDERANGIANGEGVGVVMLKRLADAQRDGDCVYGVIEGWGVNQDGKTNGITAPNADSQTRLQNDVYTRFGIDPAGIGLIEAHGTGTPLGDPIEVAGLKASFARFTTNKDYCALGSVKSNVGHCLTAAGVSGLLKVLLALKHEQLPPTINFSRLNKHISLKDSPFFVNDQLREWKRNGSEPRRAAINSFGFSGTNAHVVVAQYVAAPAGAATGAPVIVPLSARTPEQLQRKAAELLAFIRAEGGARIDLASLAYTLQTGREEGNERAAVVVATVAELEKALAAFDGAQVYRGQVSGSKDALAAMSADSDFQAMIGKWIARRELPRLAELWVKGMALDWTGFYQNPPRRMGLPGYPFAKERYWIDAVDEAPVAAPVVALPVPVAPVREASVPAEQVRQQLKASLAEALFMIPSDVDVGKSFTDLGLDSIIGVEWMKAVNRQFGTALSATRVYDYPSVSELADFIRTQIGVAEPAPAAPVPRDGLRQQLKISLAEALFMQPSDIDIDKSFTELGLDSIIGVEWVKNINRQHGTSIGATRVYDYPTVRELAAFLGGEMSVAAPVAPVPAVVAPPARVSEAATIRFEPKFARRFKDLYFHCGDGEGDIDADGEFAVRLAIDPATNVSLKEHVVFGAHLLPTDAYLELVLGACKTYFACTGVALKNLVIVNPMVGAQGRKNHIKVVFRRAGAELQFFVKSSASPDFSNDKLHMQGFIATTAAPAAGRLHDGFAVLKTLDHGDIATNAGTYYAPLQSLRFGESAALGIIKVARHDFVFTANPFALYGALCTVINYGAHLAAQRFGASDDQFLPYRIGRMAVHGELDGVDYRCYAQVRSIEHDAIEFDVEMVDRAGKVVVVIDAISLRRVARKAIEQQTTVSPLPAVVGTAEEGVAIIGMSCRYPMSESVDALWENLKSGTHCVTEVPEDRWSAWPDWYDPDPRHPHTSYSRWGGFLDNIDSFDSLFFGISPAEAELIDPQQRIFLEECWKTIESAGYAPGALSNQACGVYVGCSSGDYARVLADDGQDTAGAAFMGTSNAILAARISYHLNLKGPALALDTACSSSLVAVHLACAAIRSGETRLALAGGINVLATPLGHILTSQVGMPSRDGRCAAFDASANGIVFSEGCGVVLLKALSEAQRDNDQILGVIRGSGINQDGKTNGITAPSSRAQEQLLRQIYSRFAIDPKRIGYVEAHGTATALGDPIEVNALASVFGKPADDARHCALGSVKSNIGHAGFAAGVAGIVKVLLCIKHRKLVPSLHYSQPNPHIEFDRSPFFVNTAYRDWISDAPRMATVSSFGFSGTNAHVVIEEHMASSPSAHRAHTPEGKVLVPLSAKAEEQLQQKVRDLLAFISRQEHALDLASLAYTLQAGRDDMDHRLVLAVDSVVQLAAKLQAVLDGERDPDVARGQASKGDDTLSAFAADPEMRAVIESWVARKNLPKVADLWVKGFALDWNKLHAGATPRRMTLPTYPFARERCWVDGTGSRKSAAPRGAVAVLHPLLHRNTSDLNQQSYTSTFGGDEFFLADHRVGGEPVLPAVAYLEMARAAFMDAMPAEKAIGQLELRHVAWAQPIVVAEARSVTIAVFSDHGEQVAFEVYSESADEEVLHCQGSYAMGVQSPPQALDLERLRARMTGASAPATSLYPAFAGMGLGYGAALRGIVAVHQGDRELLVDLRLPESARRPGDYVLHPSMMDSALQGSIALIDTCLKASGKVALPFALESLRIVAPCVETMVAWVRYSAGGQGASADLIKVDIDLCGPAGDICVQMRGFSSRPMESAAAFDEAHYQAILADIVSNKISVDEAVELGNL
ncbi:SDR family NAD(P)-dependent oxidoreductase [Massilia atriviolacea]|uniref:SDR family NAD(P)-dependent oxidoreductase n=1 Tax=Massilia atriviolacea TaxID=2495579 RepID=A0A430HSC2_9BURK|nr:SDR family NAD(P)-dependent oxidoreductase [Massilia atriviolacea]RSZ60416.1 SDR family NAD(P)-dependent oxidoreductase [Massilia atriviolacea]